MRVSGLWNTGLSFDGSDKLQVVYGLRLGPEVLLIRMDHP